MKSFKHFIFGLLAVLTVALSTSQVKAQSASDDRIFYTTVDISSAEILALFTTPKVLVKVPNANFVIVPVSVIYQFKYNSVAYTNGGSCLTGYGTGTVTLTGALSLTQTSNGLSSVTVTSLSGTVANLKGKDFVLTNTTANPAAGNSTVRAHIAYRLLNLDL